LEFAGFAVRGLEVWLERLVAQTLLHSAVFLRRFYKFDKRVEQDGCGGDRECCHDHPHWESETFDQGMADVNQEADADEGEEGDEQFDEFHIVSRLELELCSLGGIFALDDETGEGFIHPDPNAWFDLVKLGNPVSGFDLDFPERVCPDSDRFVLERAFWMILEIRAQGVFDCLGQRVFFVLSCFHIFYMAM